MSSYKCSSCGSLILNGTIHGCYDVSNRVQPNHANMCPSPPPPGNDEFTYPSSGVAAALTTYGSGPSGADFTANQVDPFTAGVPSQASPLGRYPQPGGTGAGALQYEPNPSETVAEAASVVYNGKPKNCPVAYATESGAVSAQAVGALGTVVITGTAGQFSCAASVQIAVGMQLTISGTLGGTGSITGYVNPTTYTVSATNGSTTFQLTTTAGAAVVTTAGTPTGLTYSLTTAQAQGGMF